MFICCRHGSKNFKRHENRDELTVFRKRETDWLPHCDPFLLFWKEIFGSKLIFLFFLSKIDLRRNTGWFIKENHRRCVLFVKKEREREREIVNVITQLENFYDRHQPCKAALKETQFSGNTAFTVFSFYASREVSKFLYFATCNAKAYGKSIRDIRRFPPSALSPVGNLSV